MCQLEARHPDVYDKFSYFHVIRRSNQCWAGLSSDLVILQTLMRSLKRSGGLTHGSGMTVEMWSLWSMSIPITAGNEVIENMVGKPVLGISFKRKDRAKTLADEPTIKIAQRSNH